MLEQALEKDRRLNATDRARWLAILAEVHAEVFGKKWDLAAVAAECAAAAKVTAVASADFLGMASSPDTREFRGGG